MFSCSTNTCNFIPMRLYQNLQSRTFSAFSTDILLTDSSCRSTWSHPRKSISRTNLLPFGAILNRSSISMSQLVIVEFSVSRNCLKILLTAKYDSALGRFCPIQFLEPIENGVRALLMSLTESSSHRSGMNLSGSTNSVGSPSWT